MPRRPDSSLASLLLTTRLVDVGAAPLKASEYWPVIETVGDPADLLGVPADEITRRFGLAPELAGRIAARLDAATPLAFELERLETVGVRSVAAVDNDYPAVLRDRVGPAAPPHLHLAGPISLLTERLLGIVGSRDLLPQAAEVAREAGRRAAVGDTGVVSGGARGSDRLGMWAALERGGSAVGVLAEGLERARRDAAVRAAVADERLCLVTPYAPSAGFSVGNAMGRNKIIYALAVLTFVVATDEGSGGTWSGATEALRRGFGRVAVWAGEGAGPGNVALVEAGATAVSSLDDLVAAANTPEAPRAVVDEQLGLPLNRP